MHRILIGSFCAVTLIATACSSDSDSTGGSAGDTTSVTAAVGSDAAVDTEPPPTEPADTAADTRPADSEPADTEPSETAGDVSGARAIVETLASDDLAGRDNLTDGSSAARDYLYAQISEFAEPAFAGVDGIGAYLQEFAEGSNLLGVIPGSDLANEYVVIGAHYDHVGSDCRSSDPADDICNGATDNAAGVAAAISAAREVAEVGPRRTVILALWDAEEDGLLGSSYYATDPLVPMEQTVAYVNFDIQGSDLLPSIANSTLAVGAETGGPTFVDAVTAAAGTSSLDTHLLSVIFGQGRSDHVSFIARNVPSVFLTDATNACYHTAQDDVTAVDFVKLDQQVVAATALLADLASTDTEPVFDAAAPVATYDDALALLAIAEPAQVDFAMLGAEGEAVATQLLADLRALVDAGPDAFDDASIGTLLGGAAGFVEALTGGVCDDLDPSGASLA